MLNYLHEQEALTIANFSHTSDDACEDFPVGFDLKSNPIKLINNEALRLRHDDKNYISRDDKKNILNGDKKLYQSDCYILAVYFPLIILL
jgi:hypothetical protein